jgi:hypothetical protein
MTCNTPQIVKKRLNLDISLYNILQILNVTLFEKVPVIQLLANYAVSAEVALAAGR